MVTPDRQRPRPRRALARRAARCSSPRTISGSPRRRSSTPLRANPNYAGRDDDLLDNDGIEVPRGYVEANGVTLVAGGTLYVQNTGSSLPF